MPLTIRNAPILILLAGVINSPARADLVVTPLSQAINLGESGTVGINISGLGNGMTPALSSYTGLLVSYDSSILEPSSVTFSNRLGDPTDPSQTLLLSNLFLPSAVQLDGLSFLSSNQLFAAQANPNNEFNIATISFTGIADGNSAIDVTYGALADENGNAIAENSENGSITVGPTTVTPEPGTLGFAAVGAGILGCVAFVKKRCSSSGLR